MKTQLMSPDRKKLHDLFRQRHWFERDIALEVPERAVFKDGWWSEPLSSLESITEPHALTRVQAIENANIRVKKYILRTEAPALLPAPTVPIPVVPISEPVPEPKPAQALPWKVIGIATAAVMSMLVYLMAMISMMILLSPALFIDPALLVELESGEIVEVYSWAH